MYNQINQSDHYILYQSNQETASLTLCKHQWLRHYKIEVIVNLMHISEILTKIETRDKSVNTPYRKGKFERQHILLT